ncbi:hypothetical protein ACFY9N_03010 [Microbacterium sp. NPDC008134]|uniref:hypothetical protein n=1 Tax=Microbacterium sp. NPDC008134 TaxID=3364183 RepID=UPI0036E1F3C2
MGVTVCVLVRVMVRKTGVPWQLFMSGVIAASLGGATLWLWGVVDEEQIGGWARGVLMLMAMGSLLFIVVGLAWMFVRRVVAVEVPPSVSPTAEEGVLGRW